MSNRVVITGIGPVSSHGFGKDCFFENILNRVNKAERIPELFEENHRFKSHYYVPFTTFSLTDFNIPGYYEKLLQPEDRMAIAATKLALEDADFSLQVDKNKFYNEYLESASIVMGTGFTGLETAFHSYLSHLNIPDISHTGSLKNKLRFNRMIIPAMMNNSTSAWISIIFGISGTAFNMNASCASGTFAIGEAFRKIRDGYDQTVICGGVENLQESSGAVMRGFDQLSALTRTENGNPKPFTSDRSGFLFSEGGAAVLILENLEQAVSREARIYAEILDYQANTDAHNIVQIEESGKHISQILQNLRGNRKIDYLNAHGTGTEPNDRIEARMIQTLFGDKETQPLINSSKGILGHTIGASGALETALTALTLHSGFVHGMDTENCLENLNLVAETGEYELEHAITTSYGFGGHNAGLLLKRWDG